jgi:hypothetical protein
VTAKTRDCTSTLDNDCNGTADNLDSTCTICTLGKSVPCTGNSTGSCTPGAKTCTLSADKASTIVGSTCVGQVLPAAADTCDLGNDANCNGKPNEGCQCINGSAPIPCTCGTQTCTNGKLGACVTTSTPNGTICFRPDQGRGTCWAGACVLPQYFSGCKSAADCVPGGCSANGFCLGTVGAPGQVSCSDNTGAYVVCSSSEGCGRGATVGSVACGPSGTGSFCDGPNDCAAGSDCCAIPNPGAPFLGSCTVQTQPGVIGSGCPSLGPGNQLHTLCNPVIPTANCPVGQACLESTSSFLCE